MHHGNEHDPIDEVRQRLATALAGRYVIEAQSGWGGMALVFRARDLRHTRTVAIKVIRPELMTTSAAERFLDEVRIAARLQHPHIVPLYDSGEAAGLFYFVMPYIDGETLRDRIDREEQLALPAALAVTRDVADALGYAHETGIVHRDIKPENVLLSGGHALVADFGVALALSRAPRDERTDPGLAVGTYSYMSPEQASGGNGVDGRADIYAVGCLLYEMLAGHTPWGDVQERMYGGSATREAPPIGRADVPERVTQAVSRALALQPTDRFATIGEFAEALALSGVPRGVLRPPRRRPPAWLTATAAIAVAGVVMVAGFATGGGMDQSLHLVSPCEGDTGLVGAEQCQWRIAEAIGQWDVGVVHPADAIDAQRQLKLDGTLDASWTLIAKDLRAGRRVRASVVAIGDTVFLSGRLFDGAGRRPMGPTHRVVLSVDGVARTEAFAELAAGLLGLGAPRDRPGVLATRNLAAGNAYTAGSVALAEGHFREAQIHFDQAGREDRSFGDALFWSAQLASWLGDPESSFLMAASGAAANRAGQLDPLAQRLTPALQALSRGDLDQACDLYRAVIASDSTSFAGWLGLADCLVRDPVVIPDNASPSGFAFRASRGEAMRALQAALVRAPGFIGPLWPRLLRLIPTDDNVLRPGRHPGESGTTMFAWPDLVGDTAHYVPYPLQRLSGGDVALPTNRDGLIRRNRRLLRLFADQWVAAYPRDGAAWLARAEVLEALVGEAPSEAGLLDVLSGLERAAELGAPEVPTKAATARVLVRLGRWEEAGDRAAEIGMAPDVDPELVAGFAALSGRVFEAADAYEAVEAQTNLTPGLFRLVQRLDAFAGVGAPRDSIRALLRGIADMLLREVPQTERPGVEALYVEVLRLLAMPALGPDPVIVGATPHADYGQWVMLLHTGQRDSLQRILYDLNAYRRDQGIAPVLAPIGWIEHWLLAQVGDTAAAIGWLDILLGRLPSVPTSMFRHPADAAGVVRAMTLRAELAAAVGDQPTAERWARAVRALWRHGDSEVRASVAHLERMVRSPSR